MTIDRSGVKGMVTYSYTVSASEGDAISVTAECSLGSSITESFRVGEGGKDDGKDDDNRPDVYVQTNGTDDKKDDDENGRVPGFETIIALVALLGALFLVTIRRKN